jgi:hypothetical protein
MGTESEHWKLKPPFKPLALASSVAIAHYERDGHQRASSRLARALAFFLPQSCSDREALLNANLNLC